MKLIDELPDTYQTPTMAPYCKDDEKYKVVEEMVNKFQEELKNNKLKIDGQDNY